MLNIGKLLTSFSQQYGRKVERFVSESLRGQYSLFFGIDLFQLKQALRLDRTVDTEMFGVSECMEETVCESSCVTAVRTTTRGYLVGSNRTSLLAVDTWTEPHCVCDYLLAPGTFGFDSSGGIAGPGPCGTGPCRNGGTCVINSSDPRGYSCECPGEKFAGPDCELVELGFSGENGYALMKSLPSCNDTEITIAILTDVRDAIVLYNGPVSTRPAIIRKGALPSGPLTLSLLTLNRPCFTSRK